METVAFDNGRLEVLSKEDVLDRRLHCAGASTRRSGNSNDGVTCRHQVFSQQPRLVQQAGTVRGNPMKYMRFGSSD